MPENKKTFSTLVDEELAHRLKMYLVERNIPVNKWFSEVIESTINQTKYQKIAENTIPPLESHAIDKKDWMMRNLTNNGDIFSIKSGCEEWLHLIRLWNRGDLKE